MAMIGTESMPASAMPVTRFMAPGPDVAMQTPICGFKVVSEARETPWAIKAAPCSWRDMIKENTFCFSISSNTGMMAPPVYPNTNSTPLSFRDLMTNSLPFIVHLFPVVGYIFPCCNRHSCKGDR